MLSQSPISFGTAWVCGEVLIDRIPSPVTVSGSEGTNFVNIVGGGGANTAKFLSRLGCDVQFIDGLSNDPYGVLAKTELLKDNVGLDLSLHNCDKPTCLATVSLDENKEASYEFRIDDTATFDFDRNWLPDFDVHKPPDVLHVGTLATIIEPGASAIYDWAKEASTVHDVPIVFDPNIRPSVLPDCTAYQNAVERFARISTIIKASDEDIAWLHPAIPQEDVAKQWLRGGSSTSLVVITQGEDGLMSITRDGNVTNEPIATQIKVKDTVGAGDTVGAILVEGVLQHGIRKLVHNTDCLRSVLRRANHASGITCSREGCQPPTRADLE